MVDGDAESGFWSKTRELLLLPLTGGVARALLFTLSAPLSSKDMATPLSLVVGRHEVMHAKAEPSPQ